MHHVASPVGYSGPETGAKLLSATDKRHGYVTFEISQHVINGHFTTVPRPQESWSDPNAYNDQADVLLSYSADPIFLAAGEDFVLLPPNGSHVPSTAGAGGAPKKARPANAKKSKKKSAKTAKKKR